jgi:hypothetical protein
LSIHSLNVCTCAQLQEVEGRLRELRSGSKLITAEERGAVEKAFLAATDAWTKRRRMFRSIWCVLNHS